MDRVEQDRDRTPVDQAFSGKPDEYKLARTWLDQLWAKLGSRATTMSTGRDQQRVATVLGDKTQRAVLLKRHAAYAKSAKKLVRRRVALPWWRRMIDINGVSLYVAALDSAWMAGGVRL